MTRAERRAAADRLRELALLVENDLATVEIVATGVLDARVETFYGVERLAGSRLGDWRNSTPSPLADVRAAIETMLKPPDER